MSEEVGRRREEGDCGGQAPASWEERCRRLGRAANEERDSGCHDLSILCLEKVSFLRLLVWGNLYIARGGDFVGCTETIVEVPCFELLTEAIDRERPGTQHGQCMIRFLGLWNVMQI